MDKPDTTPFGLFDGLTKKADDQSAGWWSSILQLVRPTFLLLATLELCWAAAIWAFEKDSLNGLAVEIIKKIMFIGFFFSLLQFAPQWIPSLVGSFQQVGLQVSGMDANSLSTDNIINLGLATAGKLFGTSIAVAIPLWTLPEEVMGFSIPGVNTAYTAANLEMTLCIYVCIGVVISYVIVAAQFFTLKLESSILIAAGVIFLGLGSSSWTKEYVSKYLNYVMTVGVRFLVLILVLSITLSAIANMPPAPALDIVDALKLLAAAILQAFLAMKAPDMASALLSGGIGLSAGAAAHGARSGMGMLTGTVGRLASAAQGLGNVAKAVSAGRDLAKQEGKSGAAATLGGLGAAAQEAQRQLPGKLMDGMKGRGSSLNGHGGFGGRGQNPGLFDLTKQSLQQGLRQSPQQSANVGQGGASFGGGSSGVGVGGGAGESAGGKPGSSPGTRVDVESAASAPGASGSSPGKGVDAESAASTPGESERSRPPSYREGAPSPTVDDEAVSILDGPAGLSRTGPPTGARQTSLSADAPTASTAVAPTPAVAPTSSLRRASGASRGTQPQPQPPSRRPGPGPSGNN
jgi:type IV secretion system protein TrbL